jgi:gamma-glutamyltranspeptidase/glutathione hydrolase
VEGEALPRRSDEDEAGPRPIHQPQKVAVSDAGMVATAHWEATSAGAAILEEGGNAVDAAVAAAFALGVCEPAASGLGGQTMMMIRVADEATMVALDGSSRAPNRATPGSIPARERRLGYRATTVPSTPAVLEYARRRYGSRPLEALLEPAFHLADEGYEVSELQRFLTRKHRRQLRKTSAAELFLKEGRRIFKVGDTLHQPALADTLRRMARAGVEDFYTGRIARAIHADMQRNEGLLHRDDLAQIPWPTERRPVNARFDDIRIRTFPPPGAGRTLIEMLNILSNFSEAERDLDTPEGAVLVAKVIERANRDRRDRPTDPTFYAQTRKRPMLSRRYADLLAEELREEMRGETTHLSVMDAKGNVVALTQSIESVFGACVATEELGFLYNNYLTAFETRDISHPYYLRPNAVPWASVAPAIVYRRRKPWLAIGSPGSERITSSILQVLLRLSSHTPFEAVDAPRLHSSLDAKVSLEASRMRGDIPEALEAAGFEVDAREPYSFYLGCVQLVIREGKGFTGVADPRRDGSAGGPRDSEG